MNTPAESLIITIVQSELHWENAEANRNMFSEKIRLVTTPMEVVLLPEMFSTGFSMDPEKLAEPMDGPTVSWMKSIAAEKKIILAGSLIISEGGNFFNRLIWMLPNGKFWYYDKRHLFAYAGEDDKYTPGNKRLIASVKGWKINLMICYDLRFPVWSRQSVRINPLPDGGFEKAGEKESSAPEYDVLVYVANWPDKRKQAWKTLLQARAIENQCYVAGVNRTGRDGNGHYYSGDSVVVDFMGENGETYTDKESIVSYTLSMRKLKEAREKLPFLKDADPFLIGS